MIKRFRHVKRGTEYTIVGTAMLQASTHIPQEGAFLVIYKDDSGTLWAREEGEFNDGRFERIDR